MSVFFPRTFFCRLTSFGKLNDFVKDLNHNSPALKNFMIEMTNARLNKLLTELSDQLPDVDENDIYQAVSIVGKNYNRRNVPVWVLNKNVAVDGNGKLVNPKDFGLVWLSHLTKSDGINLAKEEYSCKIKLPLGTEAFDIVCHFLNGSLKVAASKNPAIMDSLRGILPDSLMYPVCDEDVEEVNVRK